MPNLFDPWTLRGVTMRNRIGVSPMCQYSSLNGFPNDWHMVHLGSRAVGGAGMVIAEATAVEARGRISEADCGIYLNEHVDAWQRVTSFIAEHGAVPAIQLAHAGRKAGWSRPWPTYRLLGHDEGGWTPVAPSAIAFNEKHPVPQELSLDDIAAVQYAFVKSAERAVAAGFSLIELHAAHGYLLNSFLSPLSNQRTDRYGGRFENRCRMLIETTEQVRKVIPDRMPLWVRLSCVDWEPAGWQIEDSVELSRRLKAAGVDAIDCSSGGNSPTAKIPVAPGYQVPFAEQIRREAQIATAAVGLITDAKQAAAVISEYRADMVLIARASLRDAYWPLRAMQELGVAPQPPDQYRRGWT
jgi:2,4-dienoyl-CoA reductase-like NADH-dependent reductase (Old Yellow Enzyme family)